MKHLFKAIFKFSAGFSRRAYVTLISWFPDASSGLGLSGEQDAGGSIYRSRLGPVSSEATRYVSSVREDVWIFDEDIECTVAHDFMLMKQGYITEDQLKQILEALKRLRDEGLSQLDLEKYEDVHELIESFVVKQAGLEVGGLVHTARSRNDQVVTAVRLKTRREVLSILRELSRA